MKFLIPLIICFNILISEIINEIKIIGNIKTKNHIILREIRHPLDIELSDSLRIEDRNRLYNLGIFSFVEIKQIENIYQINVDEIFQFYPLPLIDLDESKGSSGISYGFALSIINLNGKNQSLEIGSMLGNKQVYFLRFRDPWAIGDRIPFYLNLFQNFEQSFLYENDIENIFSNKKQGLEIGTGFNIELRNKFYFNIGLFQQLINFNNFNAFNIVQDYQNIGFEFNYSYDSRDIFIDPTKGKQFKINLNHNYGIDESESFSNINLEFNQYYEILEFKNLILNLKSKFLLQDSKHIPIFNYYSLGGEDYIRGYNPYPNNNPVPIKKYIRVSQLYSQTIEFQYTIFEKKSYDGFEFGMDNLWFIDFGLGGYSLDELLINKPLIGFGTGMRFFISGIGTIGLDLGFNPYSLNPQLHLSDNNED